MDTEKRAIALGFFDGIHVGHKALLDKTVQRAKENGLTPAIISFDTHPDNMVTGQKVGLINTPFDRAGVVKRVAGITDIIVLHFDEKLMRMDWEDFINWLINDFNASYLVAGYDFHFGYMGKGNPERLKKKCEELGIGCDIVPKVTIDGDTVSSTAIRALLKNGETEKANEYLGHPFCYSDYVIYGYKLGRRLGFPTINMEYSDDLVPIAHGVYAAKAYLPDGSEYNAIANVGVKPTVGGENRVSVETNLFDYSGNLYGERVRIDFYKFIRPEKKFSDVDKLKEQVFKDIELVKEYFSL